MSANHQESAIPVAAAKVCKVSGAAVAMFPVRPAYRAILPVPWRDPNMAAPAEAGWQVRVVWRREIRRAGMLEPIVDEIRHTPVIKRLQLFSTENS